MNVRLIGVKKVYRLLNICMEGSYKTIKKYKKLSVIPV